MACYIDVSNTFLFWHGSPTGVQRVIQGVSRAADDRFGFVVFHPKKKIWFRIPTSVMTATFAPDVFVRSNRILRSIVQKILILQPLYKNILHRLGMWAALRSRESILVKQGSLMQFQAGDRLVVLDDCWSLESYAPTLLAARKTFPELEVVGFIHDLIPLTHPQFSDPGFTKYYGRWIEQLLMASSFVMTNSKSSAAEMTRYYQGQPTSDGRFELRLPSGVKVDHSRSPKTVKFGSQLDLGSSQSRFLEKTVSTSQLIEMIQLLGYGLSEGQRASLKEAQGWLLCLGTLHPRKNLGVQLDALEPIWATNEIKQPLFWVGRKGPGMESILNRTNESEVLNSKVIMLESVPDSLVDKLFSGALVSLYTSWTEGFGLPVSESLQRGCPVIASSGGAIPEVAGDLVEYFDPARPEELRKLILKYLKSPLELDRARKRARTFRPYTWQETLLDLIGV